MKKSVFDLTHERQFTMPVDGTLIPIMCESVVPGSTYDMSNEMLARFVPLVNPVYSRFDIFKHFFFVPNRLIWENWEDFINPKNGNGTSDPPVFPAFRIQNAPISTPGLQHLPLALTASGSLCDHLGLQLDPTLAPVPGTLSAREFSVLPFRCYQKIWNDHFRDPDIEPEIEISVGDGFDYQLDADVFSLRKKCWEKDYFTSARPYPQRGISQKVMTSVSHDPMNLNSSAWDDTGATGGLDVQLGRIGNISLSDGPVSIDTHASFDIQDLREANAIQKLLERALRAGEHYHDMLKVFFGIKSPDSRFQRSEYIGGGRQPISISEVLQTSQSDLTPLGTYGGHGISAGSDKIGKFFAPEHGYIIGLVSIMPRAVYGSQIRKDFFKTSRFDFYFPDLANLGEQSVDLMEIQANPFLGDPNETFGYQERWAEHRFSPSTIHGMFRNDAILKLFTAARVGAYDYMLDPEFIHVGTADDVNRIFATTSVDPVLVSTINHVKAVMPIPRHSNPSLL